jgi:GTPase Era involved in 16S rRNA processing
LYRRRNTPVKECILSSLQTVDIIVAKIEAKTMTETMTETTTETTETTTETLVTIRHTDTADPEDVAMSARKRIADHRNIQR